MLYLLIMDFLTKFCIQGYEIGAIYIYIYIYIYVCMYVCMYVYIIYILGSLCTVANQVQLRYICW